MFQSLGFKSEKEETMCIERCRRRLSERPAQRSPGRPRGRLPARLAAMVLVVWGAAFARGQPVVITFDDLPHGAAVLNQYAAQGITFNRPTCLDYSRLAGIEPGFARSGTKAIEQCFGQEFCSTPIEMSFTTGQRRVKIWVGYSAPNAAPLTVVLTGFGRERVIKGGDGGAAGGPEIQVAEATVVIPARTTPLPVTVPLEIAVSSSPFPVLAVPITHARVTVRPGFPQRTTAHVAIDDIEFDTAGPPPPCPSQANPKVLLASPAHGSLTQVGSFLLEGRIETDAPLIEASLSTAPRKRVSISNIR
jgi:hypothetical protein